MLLAPRTECARNMPKTDSKSGSIARATCSMKWHLGSHAPERAPHGQRAFKLCATRCRAPKLLYHSLASPLSLPRSLASSAHSSRGRHCCRRLSSLPPRGSAPPSLLSPYQLHLRVPRVSPCALCLFPVCLHRRVLLPPTLARPLPPARVARPRRATAARAEATHGCASALGPSPPLHGRRRRLSWPEPRAGQTSAPTR